MKVLIITQYPKLSGVDYHRLWIPHGNIGKNHGVEISQVNEIDTAEIDFLQAHDLVVANRFISKTGNQEGVIQKLKQAGVPYILDLDDDYRIPEWHVLRLAAKKMNHSGQIATAAKGALAVTTTHSLLADAIKKELGQKNVYIVPNGIDTNEEQFKIHDRQQDVTTFGWSGSVTHFEDVLEMFESLLGMYKNHDNFKIVYGGFESQDMTSQAMAGILTAKGIAKPEQFSYYAACDVSQYALFYEAIDVALIPLRNNRFNNMKSNLKMLEAGFKKKAAIVSNVWPYSEIIADNCLKVNHKNDWYKQMTKLLKNPNMIADLAEKLYESVQPYEIKHIAETRFNIYKQCLN